jgi:S1-C subfamily serine protease
MSDEKGSTSRLIYVVLLILIVTAGNTVVLFYTALSPSLQGGELSNRISQLENLNNRSIDQIKALRGQIDQLNAQIQGMGSGNGAEAVPLTLIYNLTKDSVVLIENRIMFRGSLILQGLGAGFVFHSNEYVATNNHVVEGADELVVNFLDGNVSKAEVVGSDPYSDLAILRLTREMPWLKPLPVGNSSKLRVGETVIAIGSPFGLGSTMTSGIVSQTGRELSAVGGFVIVDVIQHDVAINPGNSGGPLINLRGEVVGINTAIESTSGASSGVGFAIPSDTLAREAQALISTGTYRHPYLGIGSVDMDPDIAEAVGLNISWGVLVTQVAPGGPADEAGLRGGNAYKTILGQMVRVGGDLIVAVDGHRVLRADDLNLYIERNKRPGDQLVIAFLRGGEKLSLTMTLGERLRA